MADADFAGFGASANSGAVRIGTAEREQAAAALGEHFAAGRLEVAEYDDRVARAYAAKTTADLAVLFSDLPRPVTQRPTQAAMPAGPARPVLPVIAFVVLIAAVVLAVTVHVFPFFIVPVLLFVFIRSRRGWGRQVRGPRRHYRM
ncbi:DUF1707 SHOCT-like domain-containing protein [Nocardia macrotermitis]|uniref:DUF1707 domain-containing protein n=1 Tax=Nocardia macrotermitis TaxID=2585198 RepID=A0A7K0D7X0_9NOCA|nr:DUF1707 domain-containing protein [Nocardia macrotermitis]MQY21890.1 hypothetical protein [Nocardia macrotermitis]